MSLACIHLPFPCPLRQMRLYGQTFQESSVGKRAAHKPMDSAELTSRYLQNEVKHIGLYDLVYPTDHYPNQPTTGLQGLYDELLHHAENMWMLQPSPSSLGSLGIGKDMGMHEGLTMGEREILKILIPDMIHATEQDIPLSTPGYAVAPQPRNFTESIDDRLKASKHSDPPLFHVERRRQRPAGLFEDDDAVDCGELGAHSSEEDDDDDDEDCSDYLESVESSPDGKRNTRNGCNPMRLAEEFHGATWGDAQISVRDAHPPEHGAHPSDHRAHPSEHGAHPSDQTANPSQLVPPCSEATGGAWDEAHSSNTDCLSHKDRNRIKAPAWVPHDSVSSASPKMPHRAVELPVSVDKNYFGRLQQADSFQPAQPSSWDARLVVEQLSTLPGLASPVATTRHRLHQHQQAQEQEQGYPPLTSRSVLATVNASSFLPCYDVSGDDISHGFIPSKHLHPKEGIMPQNIAVHGFYALASIVENQSDDVRASQWLTDERVNVPFTNAPYSGTHTLFPNTKAPGHSALARVSETVGASVKDTLERNTTALASTAAKFPTPIRPSTGIPSGMRRRDVGSADAREHPFTMVGTHGYAGSSLSSGFVNNKAGGIDGVITETTPRLTAPVAELTAVIKQPQQHHANNNPSDVKTFKIESFTTSEAFGDITSNNQSIFPMHTSAHLPKHVPHLTDSSSFTCTDHDSDSNDARPHKPREVRKSNVKVNNYKSCYRDADRHDPRNEAMFSSLDVLDGDNDEGPPSDHTPSLESREDDYDVSHGRPAGTRECVNRHGWNPGDATVRDFSLSDGIEAFRNDYSAYRRQYLHYYRSSVQDPATELDNKTFA